MNANRRCWWCGLKLNVDTEQPSGPGWVRDSDTSWLCDGTIQEAECNARAVVILKRNKGRSSVPRADNKTLCQAEGTNET